jgi:hypothetical protein
MKSSDDPNQRYLGLTGIIMRETYASGDFATRLAALKQSSFGRSDFPLHRRDIVHMSVEPYTALRDQGRRQAFDAALLDLLETATYRVVTAVIDKKAHKEKYAVWRFDPYHYCMNILLERYALFLKAAKDVGDVMAESREKKDNKRLSKDYKYVYKHGTPNLRAAFFQERLSSTEIKIKRKGDNVAGLQLADLIANPSCRDLICRNTNQAMTANFGSKVVEILYRKKYRRSATDGKVIGYGTKWLP